MYIKRSTRFKKQYKKLSVKARTQFLKRLHLYCKDRNDPLLRVHSLQGNYKGLLSFNVTADIRVIFDTSEEEALLLIAIGSHGELYS